MCAVNLSKPNCIKLCWVSGVHCTLYIAHTGNYCWTQAGFDKFTHTYLCTQQTLKVYEFIVVNQALPSLHGESLNK